MNANESLPENPPMFFRYMIDEVNVPTIPVSGGFLRRGVPRKIIHGKRIFHYKPSILGYIPSLPLRPGGAENCNLQFLTPPPTYCKLQFPCPPKKNKQRLRGWKTSSSSTISRGKAASHPNHSPHGELGNKGWSMVNACRFWATKCYQPIPLILNNPWVNESMGILGTDLLEVPTIFFGLVREYPHKIWPEKWYVYVPPF